MCLWSLSETRNNISKVVGEANGEPLGKIQVGEVISRYGVLLGAGEASSEP